LSSFLFGLAQKRKNAGNKLYRLVSGGILLLPSLLTEEVVTRILESLFNFTLRKPNIIILFG
jgi:hypothetical protein